MGVIVLLLAFTACSDEITEVQSNELRQIVMTASDFETEDGSRTNFQITSSGAEFSWATNDTVGIFPNEGAQAYFPMTSGAGTKSANFTGGGWALKDASTYAAYYPFIGDFYLNKNAIPVDYTGQVQTGDASTAHLGAYDYMAAAPSTPKNGNVSFAFKHLGALVQLKLTLPQATTLNSVALTTESEAFAVNGKVDIMASSLGITSVTSSKDVTLEVKNVATTENNQVVTLYMMLPPVDLTGKALKAVVKTSNGSEEVSLDSKNFQAGKAYALSGSLKDPNGGIVVGNNTYKDGVVSIATAGTMKKLLGDDYLNITSLKVVGPINGDDVYYLRKMMACDDFSKADCGKLTSLDLSDATIVEGGEWYYSSDKYEYNTEYNVIGNNMFNGNDLHDFILPKNITSIENFAFYGCTSLTSVTIPDKVTKISDCAFYGCTALTTINIPNGVTFIGESAFRGCTSLTSITIPDNVLNIYDCTFEECESLTDVAIGNGVVSIGSWAFRNCKSLTTLKIGSEVTLIKSEAFDSCTSLTSVTIPDKVTQIGRSAFYGCKSLTTLKIGSGVTNIDGWAFKGCPISTCYSYATTPPTLHPTISSMNNGQFDDGVEKGSKLYVPARCGSKYKTSGWGSAWRYNDGYVNERRFDIIEMD